MENLPKELQIHIMEFMVPRMSQKMLKSVCVEAALLMYEQNSTINDCNHIFNILQSCNCCDRHTLNKPSYIGHIIDYPPCNTDPVIRECACACRHICRQICLTNHYNVSIN